MVMYHENVVELESLWDLICWVVEEVGSPGQSHREISDQFTVAAPGPQKVFSEIQ